MTNNRQYTPNFRHTTKSSDRARAITKAKARKQNIILSVAAFALVAVVAGSCIAFGAFSPKTKATTADVVPTTVTMAKDSSKNAQGAKKAASQTATQAAQTDQQTDTSYTQNDDVQTYVPTQSADSSDQNAQDEGRIDTVDGERIYIDTKRNAPDGSGTPAHFYASGKTSYGFDWNYDADNGNFVIRCDYNFDQQQYDFQFYGTAPGTANITVYYNTDDNTQASQTLTLVVDDNLNASIV